MSEKPPALFGWDLLYQSIEKDVKTNQDVLVCFVHLILVSNGFKCIGIGESKTLDGTESKTEALPSGWNDGYAIRYIYQGRLYNLKGSEIEDGIIINLIRTDERSVSMVQLNSRMVLQRTGSLDNMIPDNLNILDLVKKQLIDKVVVSTKTRDTSSQTPKEPQRLMSDQTPARLMDPQRSGIGPFLPPLGIGPIGGPIGGSPLGVGSSDLHPFGANPMGLPPFGQPDFGTGGMLFVPPRGGGPFGPDINTGIPGGSLPPGARFDPFRPPDVDRFPRPRPNNNPDNDEMPPPGFDNMFM
ncbi:proteasome inhibitor PI31 subunit [Onthophagus taurus]|uniref:proteasome inhibitor PI31 subunit n=1 Tax=Onthophagus taurus TaxID=166361 RepID=UPI0039BEA00C